VTTVKKQINSAAVVNKPSALEQAMLDKLEALERENEQLRNSIVGDDEMIRLDSYVEIMSLIPWKLNLSTEKNGRGRTFSFSSFGETKRILYNDLASVFENYRTFMEQGYFYILNPKVIRKHGLDDVYSKILNKEMIEKVLACDPNVAVKLYTSATNAQKATIESMLVKKLKDEPDNVDLNIISQISKIADKDLIKLADEAKQLEAAPKN